MRVVQFNDVYVVMPEFGRCTVHTGDYKSKSYFVFVHEMVERMSDVATDMARSWNDFEDMCFRSGFDL